MSVLRRALPLSLKDNSSAVTTAALKKKIKSLVDEKRSAVALRRIHDLLVDPELELDAERELRARLDHAEEDIKAGRVMDAAEAKQRLKTSLKRHRSDKNRAGKRA